MNDVTVSVFAVYLTEYPDEGSTHVIAWGESDAIAKVRKDEGDLPYAERDEYAAVRVYGPASEAECDAWVQGWGEGYEEAEKLAALEAKGGTKP